MKGNNNIIIGLIVLVLGSILGLQWIFSKNAPNYNWDEQLVPNSEQPYGLKYFKELLNNDDQQIIDANKPLSETLSDSVSGTYLQVSSEIYVWGKDAEALLDWVEKGNTAFFSCEEAPWFLDSITGYSLDSAKYFYYNDSATISLSKLLDRDSNVNVYYNRYRNDTTSRNWNYITDSAYYWEIQFDGKIESLGRLLYGHNFFKIAHGKGNFYVHLEPIFFSNYHLLTDDGFEYASNAISVIDTGTILWGKYHNSYHYDQEESGPSQSPLSVIFANPALRISWIVLLAGIVLFVLFKSKREQRVIPLIYYPENTSKAYASALGALYHRTGEPKFLASEMVTMFHNYNRKKYHIQFKIENKEFAQQLAKKAGVNQKLIEDILVLERRLVYSDLAKMSEIIPLYELLNTYYKASK
ncbi:MAG: DUF4350 domain-containing protein [Salibacteraceae bacterium]|nr:DUF4350 domain-containing protein [Salibacteraceae bacterium]